MASPPVVELDLDSESIPDLDLDGQSCTLHTPPASSAMPCPSPQPSQLSQPDQCIRGGSGYGLDVYDSQDKGNENKDNQINAGEAIPKQMPAVFQPRDPLVYPKDLFALECAQCRLSGDSICRYVRRGNPHTQLVYIDRKITAQRTTAVVDDVTKGNYVRERRAQIGALLQVLERPSWLDEQCRDLIVATSMNHIIACVEYLIRKDWQSAFASWQFAGVEDM